MRYTRGRRTHARRIRRRTRRRIACPHSPAKWRPDTGSSSLPDVFGCLPRGWQRSVPSAAGRCSRSRSRGCVAPRAAWTAVRFARAPSSPPTPDSASATTRTSPSSSARRRPHAACRSWCAARIGCSSSTPTVSSPTRIDARRSPSTVTRRRSSLRCAKRARRCRARARSGPATGRRGIGSCVSRSTPSSMDGVNPSRDGSPATSPPRSRTAACSSRARACRSVTSTSTWHRATGFECWPIAARAASTGWCRRCSASPP